MLKGKELLEKIKELGDITKSDLVRACGYVSFKQDGSERLGFTSFYEALLEAKGVPRESIDLSEDEEGDDDSLISAYASSELSDTDQFLSSPLGKAFTRLNKEGIRAHSDCGASMSDGISCITAGGYKGPWVFFHEQDYGYLLESNTTCIAFGTEEELEEKEYELTEQNKLDYFNKDKKRFFNWNEDRFNKIVEEATNAPIDDSKEYPDKAKVALVDHSGVSAAALLDELDGGSRCDDIEQLRINFVRDHGNRVIALLEEEGIQCSWDGDIDKRILIKLNYNQKQYMTFQQLFCAAYQHLYMEFDANYYMLANMAAWYMDEEGELEEEESIECVSNIFNKSKEGLKKEMLELFIANEAFDDIGIADQFCDEDEFINELEWSEIFQAVHLFCDEQTIKQKLARRLDKDIKDVNFKKSIQIDDESSVDLKCNGNNELDNELDKKMKKVIEERVEFLSAYYNEYTQQSLF